MLPFKNRIRFAVLLLIVIGTLAPTPAPAESWKQIIVKCSPEDLANIQSQFGAAIVDAIPGHYLLNVSASTDVNALKHILGKGPVQAGENSKVALYRGAPRTASAAAAATRSAGSAANWYGTPALSGYTTQPAISKLSLTRALDIATGSGVRIAIIDTGVDEQHPTLKSVLLPGRNYVGRTAIPSETDDPVVAQATTSILDQATTSILDQATTSILDQATTSILDQLGLHYLPSEFGHGTMMAGLVHLVAPNARIIPLKAFDASGASTEWNIVRAIYDAVDMGADVISMSFSASQNSDLLEDALSFAASRGVILVAASGNSNVQTPTYPASLRQVIAVSALDLNDQKATFANYGDYVDVSALGVNLITTYPGGHWAMGSGTSDSAPLVAGVAALILQHGEKAILVRQGVSGGVDPLSLPAQYRDKLGKGRLNAFKAVSFRDGN